MSDHPESFDHMVAAWNERDPEKIRGHLDRALAPDVVFCDPVNFTHGIDEFEAMVREFRATTPNASAGHSSSMDHHHDLYRYAWEVYDGDTLAVAGMDVTRVNGDGMVERVDGFFGPIPALGE